jgi:cytochrome c biogenesis protein CcdA
MLIVAVAWIYVVGLMALTEPTVVAGIMTFLSYCVLPLSIIYYIFGRRRKPRRPPAPPPAQDGSSGAE